MSNLSVFRNMKLFYDINEAADILNVNASKIRFYEKQLNLRFKRVGRDRRLMMDDIEKLRKIFEEREKGNRTVKGSELIVNNKRAVNKKKKEIIDKLLAIRGVLEKTLGEL